ncbi:MAG: restriction endonuclease, partial [Proteobacteria bacterium]|nr:restriction endonuclease [Pseudomonadota bacterium]
MKNKKLLIDFREISEYHRGEGLEALTRELGKRLGLNPAWSGRGPDDGKDLLFTEIINGQLANVKIRWLVSCKDFSESGRAVNETDAGSILDKVKQHNANGFLLVTTTTVTSGLKKVLDGLNKGEIDRIRTHVWDGYS